MTLALQPILKAKTADDTAREKLIARLERNILRGVDGDCWTWIGRRNKAGYGRLNLRHDGRHITVYAHRLMFTLAKGRECDRRFVLDHTCCNTRCCNPQHLQPTTLANNTRLRHQRTVA